MTKYVRVAVNVPSLAGVFDYAIPQSLAGEVGIGQLVIVPFGPQTVQAVVLEHIDKPSVSYAKEVLSIIDPVPVLTPAQIALANSLSATTLSPLAGIVGLFLPTGLAQQADAQYSIVLPEALSTADTLLCARDRTGTKAVDEAAG